jgi:dTDP-4-dehydrorhamnose 3,5-epimerase
MGHDLLVQRINQVSIEWAALIPLLTHVDDRGYLLEVVRNDDSHFLKFGQVYFVGNFVRGVIRGFHKHLLQWDWFFIGHGSAKFVLVDDRSDSATVGHMNVLVTSARNPSLIAVPPGVFHGWMSLEDDTQLVGITSEVYRREDPDEHRIPPDAFGGVWSIEGR